jgi:hypothetical protein
MDRRRFLRDPQAVDRAAAQRIEAAGERAARAEK